MPEQALGDVEATFDYLRDPPTDDPSQAICYFVEDRSKNTMRVEPVPMVVHDGRKDVASYSLEVQGFQLVKHRTSITDWLDQDRLLSVYPNEVADLVREVTGAAHAIGLGAGVRFGDHRTVKGKNSDDKPAFFPHSDFTDEGAKGLVTRFAADAKGYSRCAIYNVWRAFSQPPQDYPLAVCDARSVEPSDERQADAYVDLSHYAEPFHMQTVVYQPNRDNRWTYFSNMAADEVLLFKGWDSDPSRPKRAPHSAFRHPLATPEWHSRSSVDSRVIAFYD